MRTVSSRHPSLITPTPSVSSGAQTPGVDIDGILFDVDETLFDRRRAQRLVLAQMQQRLPTLLGHVSSEDLSRAWTASDKATEDHVFHAGDLRAARDTRSRILLEELGRPADAESTGAITDAYLDLYAVVEAPIEGARHVVERCGEAFCIGVLSNAYPDVQYRKLETLGLHDAFACILLSEEFGARKPDPSIFLEGCRQLQVEPARCLYVGDSYRNDVVGAAAAGMPCCWFNAISDPVTGSAKATIEIDRLSDLLLWLGLAAE